MFLHLILFITCRYKNKNSGKTVDIKMIEVAQKKIFILNQITIFRLNVTKVIRIKM